MTSLHLRGFGLEDIVYCLGCYLPFGQYGSATPPSIEYIYMIDVERRVHLLRKLYDYHLVIDLCFGASAESSCQRSFGTIYVRYAAACCC